MPLTKKHLPEGLVFANGQLNTGRHKELGRVTGCPALAEVNPQINDAAREAFAALYCAGYCSGEGRGEQVYLGEAAVQFLYGRKKKKGEQDCDVIARVMHSAEYGYVLGEGKGADIGKAKEQFDTACRLLAAHPTQPGPVWGAVIVMAALNYLEWDPRRHQWVAWKDAIEDENMTRRLREDAAVSLQRDHIYLTGGPEDSKDGRRLSTWCVLPGDQPFAVWTHERSATGGRGSFRPVRVGQGQLKIFYVAH